ncbi:MAG: CBS domain-containing protein [Betaproteobacteria bacterium]|nr:CBS domain-containing protein [Betaproteobacteria bacterium]
MARRRDRRRGKVMTDFRERSAISVREHSAIDAALEHMKHAGVRSAFVLDRDGQKVLGMITAYDIQGGSRCATCSRSAG